MAHPNRPLLPREHLPHSDPRTQTHHAPFSLCKLHTKHTYVSIPLAFTHHITPGPQGGWDAADTCSLLLGAPAKWPLGHHGGHRLERIQLHHLPSWQEPQRRSCSALKHQVVGVFCVCLCHKRGRKWRHGERDPPHRAQRRPWREQAAECSGIGPSRPQLCQAPRVTPSAPHWCPAMCWGRTLLSITGTLRPGKGPQMEACASEKGPKQLLAAGQMPAGRQLCPRLSGAYTLRPSWRGSQASFQICGKPHAARMDDDSSHVHTGKSEKPRGSDAATHTLLSSRQSQGSEGSGPPSPAEITGARPRPLWCTDDSR